MTWFEFGQKQSILTCAAVFVAHFVCVGVAAAQDVVFRSTDNAVEVSGSFVGFDGAFVTVKSDAGLVSFASDGMVCDGATCPDLVAYVPRIRMIGAGRVGDVLMPALIDVYARDFGWTVTRDTQGAHVVSQDGQGLLDVTVTVASPDDSFGVFVSHQADMLMSMRELRPSELDAAFDAGLGRLDVARQARILALDALVPVASPTSNETDISLARLIAVVAGQTAEYDVHLPESLDGQLQGFEDRILGEPVTETAIRHASMADVLGAVEAGENGLSLVPFGATRNTQPLALSGPCGLQSDARFLTLKTEDYPLTFPIFLYVPQRRQHPQVDAFLDWLRSPSAQLVIRRAGLVDLAAVPISLGDQGDRLANAIANAGAEVPLGELQRMIRLLRPRVRMSSTFRFEPGSTRLDGQSRSNVMQLAQAIRDGQFGQRELMFVGFSDGRGPAEANRDLSSARAEAVMRDIQRALGGNVPVNVQLETDAFGEALPMACDDTVWGQQTNRRVELWVRDLP